MHFLPSTATCLSGTGVHLHEDQTGSTDATAAKSVCTHGSCAMFLEQDSLPADGETQLAC